MRCVYMGLYVRSSSLCDDYDFILASHRKRHTSPLQYLWKRAHITLKNMSRSSHYRKSGALSLLVRTSGNLVLSLMAGPLTETITNTGLDKNKFLSVNFLALQVYTFPAVSCLFVFLLLEFLSYSVASRCK